MRIVTNLFVIFLLLAVAWFLGQKKQKRNPHSRTP